MLINEFSNGSSGLGEFYEFIVAGKCGDVVDVSGYILDDNNGTFSTPGSYPSGSGIAKGHLRLTNHAQWTSIPVGSIIVVYNDDDRNSSLPVADPYDSDTDSLYVVPHTNTALFEITEDLPNAGVPDSTYSPAIYSSISWTPLGIANGGDAVQIRKPNGDYFFGVSYGDSKITGPDNTKIYNGSMSGKNGYFSNGDFKDPANWDVGNAPADETPGTFNNSGNEVWLRLMRDPDATSCPVTPLPVSLVLFDGEYTNAQVELEWESQTEQNNDYYTVSHSTNGFYFAEIGRQMGAGSSSIHHNYNMIHRNPPSGLNYYQLKSTDFDGITYDKGMISVLVNRDQIIYNQLTSELVFPKKGNYVVYTVTGQKVVTVKNQSHDSINQTGIFFVYNSKTGITTKVIIP